MLYMTTIILILVILFHIVSSNTEVQQQYFVTEYININPLENLPSPRVLSNALGQQYKQGNPDGISSLFIYLGQFIDHDISLTPVNKTASQPICLEKDDPLYKWNNGSMEFFKSQKKLINLNTNQLDLGNVYGDTLERREMIRGNNGLLKMGTDGLMHRDEDGNFICGDIRCNVNTILIGIHTLFVMEHNRLVKKIKQRNSKLSDEQIFKRAKQQNIHQYQKIIYEEWLPLLLGKNKIPKKNTPLYSDDYFSSVTFRYGHSMIPEHILYRGEKENLFDNFFKPLKITNMTILTDYMIGVQQVEQEDFDLEMVDSLRNHLFPSSGHRLDLMALNIQRGRDHHLGSYLKYSNTKCRNSRAFWCFYKITRDVKLAKKLKKLYKSADRIDNFIGVLSEPKFKKSLLGKTVTKSILRHFQSLAFNDPNFYSKTNYKSLKQLFKIHYKVVTNSIFHIPEKN